MTDPTPVNPPPGDDGTVAYVPHDEFRAGLPRGRFRVIVNPTLARPWIVRRTWTTQLSIAVIGIGAALAVSGHAWVGLAVVALGIAGNRLVRHQAGKLVLHLALTDRAVYDEVTSNGVMEVQAERP